MNAKRKTASRRRTTRKKEGRNEAKQADNASETLILKLALRYTDSERVVALPPSITVEALLAIALSVFDFLGGHLSKITRKDG